MAKDHSYVITLDSGTTNTRATLWESSGQPVDVRSAEVGVRDTAIDGNNYRLAQAAKTCMEDLLKDRGISWEDVGCVMASGMITSNVGLVEIPHLTAPAGVKELAAGVQCVTLPQVCPLPIHFIPGIKNTADPITLDNLESMDIMRGEEVESVALIHHAGTGTPLLLALPGSHSKFVGVNAQGQITGCLTSITGELLSVITNNTILADAVQRQFVSPEHYDREMMLLGCRTAAQVGLGRACFSGRVMNLFAGRDHWAVANYLLGCVLQSDAAALRNSQALRAPASTRVIVAGKQPLCRAICDVLTQDGYFAQVEEYVPKGSGSLSGQGALIIAKLCGLI